MKHTSPEPKDQRATAGVWEPQSHRDVRLSPRCWRFATCGGEGVSGRRGSECWSSGAGLWLAGLEPAGSGNPGPGGRCVIGWVVLSGRTVGCWRFSGRWVGSVVGVGGAEDCCVFEYVFEWVVDLSGLDEADVGCVV